MIQSVKKSCSNYREQLMAKKILVDSHINKNNNDKKTSFDQQEEFLVEEKNLLEKQKCLAKEMKEVESLIKEGTNRLEDGLRTGNLSEMSVAKLLIDGGQGKLASINEQHQQTTNDLDKLRLKRKDALMHSQTAYKKMKQT